MLLALIISAHYTNLLQSIVIVPGSQVAGLSLDEMTHQNFTFVAFSAWLLMLKKDSQEQELRSWSNIETNKNWEFLRKEKLIGDRVQRWCSHEDRFAFCLKEISRDTKKVLIADQDSRLIFEKITLELGRNVIVGEERFFDYPYFWTFQAEKSHMLIESMDRIKSTGLMYHFLARSVEKALDLWVQHLLEPLRANEDDDEVGTSSGLSDSINMEAMTLFYYCVACCVIAFIMELSLSRVKGFLRKRSRSVGSAN